MFPQGKTEERAAGAGSHLNLLPGVVCPFPAGLRVSFPSGEPFLSLIIFSISSNPGWGLKVTLLSTLAQAPSTSGMQASEDQRAWQNGGQDETSERERRDV